MVAVGSAFIVMEAVVVLLQVPLPNEYVIVNVPGVLVAKLIAPVAALITTPAGAVYVPPACPVCVTVAFPVAQYGEAAYEIVAVGSALIVMLAVVVLLQVPLLNEYVIV